MVAHSPAPWTPLLDHHSKNKRERMALVSTPNGRMAIDCTNSGASYAEDCANARLIAAAPKLLTALEHMVGIGEVVPIWVNQALELAKGKANG